MCCSGTAGGNNGIYLCGMTSSYFIVENWQYCDIIVIFEVCSIDALTNDNCGMSFGRKLLNITLDVLQVCFSSSPATYINRPKKQPVNR